MRIVEWTPISYTENIPPFGEELRLHLKERKCGGESYAAWNLLYRVLIDNRISYSKVCFTESGKPYFEDNHLHFSLTHSGSICAVSIADVPTGIDVERLDRVIPNAVIKRVLSLENLMEEPIFGWCKNEVKAKITGTGIIAETETSNNNSGLMKIKYAEKIVKHEDKEYLIVVGYQEEIQ